LSPGPGRCENAGICIDIVKELHSEIPILGVCLGHQAICTAFGAKVSYAKRLMHGKSSRISLDSDSIFGGLPNEISVGRYHSLSLLEDTLPDSLKIISKSDDGEVMAVKHKEFDVYGLQFHPESILTLDGLTIMENFLNKL
jgi:anthranilate synthase component 2